MIQFIVPTIPSRREKLEVLLSSLRVQTSNWWTAMIVSDGDTSPGEDWSKYNGKVVGYSVPGPNNDCGHVAREFGKDKSQSPWIVMTGDDNYYCPTFVEEFSRFMTSRDYDFVYCNMIHNSFDYQPLVCKLESGQIDVGAFAIRTSIAQKIPWGRGYDADGRFVEEYVRRYGTRKVAKVDKYLYVHN